MRIFFSPPKKRAWADSNIPERPEFEFERDISFINHHFLGKGK
jgi:hypothetical protein